MGKLIFLAMTTVDGCISNLAGIKEWGLNRDVYGVTELYDKADSFIKKGIDIINVKAIRETTCGPCLYEPEPGMEDLTRQIFENRLVDELYLYIFSYTVGSGISVFPPDVKVSDCWKLEEAKLYNEEIVRLHYSRVDTTVI